jgi:hypothetical protein
MSKSFELLAKDSRKPLLIEDLKIEVKCAGFLAGIT